MLSDVYVRTSGGVSRLCTGLPGVCQGGGKRLLAGLDPFGMQDAEMGGLHRRSAVELVLKNTLCAFKSQPLPALEERLREAALQSLGVRGRPGIAVSAVCGWCAEHLPEQRATPFKGNDWDALARKIDGQATAKAEPAFAKA